MTLISVFTRYWTEHSDRRANPWAARRAGALLLDFLGNAAKVSELSKSKQREFIAHLHGMGMAVGYIVRIQQTIAAALNRARRVDEEEGGLLLRVPKVIINVREIADLLDVPEPLPDNWHPTIEQIAAFMDAAVDTSTLRYAILMVAFAGRPEAVRDARSDQFDARHGLIAWNPASRRQTKKYRPTVPVPERLLPHMARWASEGERFVDGPVRQAWGRTLMKAGDVRFAPKRLRHFMATEMRKRGVPQEQRELWMGHRRHSTNDRYGQFAPDYLKDAKACADQVLAELEALCKLPLFRDIPPPHSQVSAKPGLQRFDPLPQNPVNLTVKRCGKGLKVA